MGAKLAATLALSTFVFGFVLGAAFVIVYMFFFSDKEDIDDEDDSDFNIEYQDRNEY